MKASKWSAIIACASITVFGCSRPSDNGSGKGIAIMDMAAATTTKEKAEISISLPEKPYADEAIVCIVSLKNRDNSSVFYGHSTDYKDFKVVVYDSRGKLAPFTRFGELELSENEDEPRDKYIVKEIVSGAVHQRRYNLSSLFDLTVAGRYTVCVSIEMNPNIRDKKPFALETRANFEIIER